MEYDGSKLCGWQRQKNGPTVQQHLDEAIAAMTHEPTQTLGASRTDAGVHALGQVCIFKTRCNIPTIGFLRGLNTSTPESIAVRSVTHVADDFHPRFDARGKHYRYTLLNRPTPSPLVRLQSWHRPMVLDVAAMQEAAQVLVGEHDFSAFRAAGCNALTATRRITELTVQRAGDLVTIDVWGNAFLRNMVRIVAGTLTEIGAGVLGKYELGAILESRDRRAGGQTAPPQGLCLVEVFYHG